MTEQLKQRILRRLDIFARISEGIEDTMRAARIPIKAVSATTGLMDSAGKVMKGVAAATKSVVDEALQAAETPKAIPPIEGGGPA